MGLELRKALSRDVASIHDLLMSGAEKGLLLPRSRAQIFTALRDFYVFADAESGKVAGCCALAVIWEGIAEIRSLYVDADYRRQGLGAKLVAACMEDAVSLGIPKIFTLTYQTEFFASLGYEVVPKETLPQKIWTDCVHCPKFPNCDEIAMIRSA